MQVQFNVDFVLVFWGCWFVVFFFFLSLSPDLNGINSINCIPFEGCETTGVIIRFYPWVVGLKTKVNYKMHLMCCSL